jgi:hypothetical protein
MTLNKILIKAAKYIEDSTADKNMLILTKNPIVGGKPAIENKEVARIRAST